MGYIIIGRPQGFAPTVIFQSFFRRVDPRGRPLQDFTLFLFENGIRSTSQQPSPPTIHHLTDGVSSKTAYTKIIVYPFLVVAVLREKN
jgi:hypothetical protein